MKLGTNAILTIIAAVIAGVLPHLFGGSLVVTIICIVLGIAAFLYGLSAFRGKKANVWNIIALVVGILSIISAVTKLIILL